MKKLSSFLLMYLFAAVLLFQSCTSEAPNFLGTEPDDKLHDVTFSLEGFQVKVDPFKSTSTTRSLSDKYLSYWVFLEGDVLNEATGNVEKDYAYIVAEGEFDLGGFAGKIKLKLPNGVYKIVAFLSDGPVGALYQMTPTAGGSPANYAKNGIWYEDITKDLFRGDVNFLINGSGISESLVLRRPISKINLAFDDLNKVPSSVNALVPVLYSVVESGNEILQPYQMYLSGESLFSFGDGYISEGYKNIAVEKKDIPSYNKNNPISFYFPQNQNYRLSPSGEEDLGKHDLYLVGTTDAELGEGSLELDGAKVVFATLLKKNIELKPAQSITISGSLFDPNKISIKINGEWDGTEEIDF